MLCGRVARRLQRRPARDLSLQSFRLRGSAAAHQLRKRLSQSISKNEYASSGLREAASEMTAVLLMNLSRPNLDRSASTSSKADATLHPAVFVTQRSLRNVQRRGAGSQNLLMRKKRLSQSSSRKKFPADTLQEVTAELEADAGSCT